MSLKGKSALVTGGGTGVGRATALMLAARGAHVAVNYSRSVDEASATVGEIEALGVDAVAIQADVASDAAVKAMVEQTVAVFGRLDVVVNSAGMTAFVAHGDLDGMHEELEKAERNRLAALERKAVTSVANPNL